ncbi:hypothetical protein TOC8171_23050 [Pseudomonas syringae]
MAKPSDSADICQAPVQTAQAPLPKDSALDDLIGYAMRRAQLKLFQNLIGRLSAHDLRPAQFSALAIIEQTPGLMQADLAKALAIEPPQVVPLLNKLEDARWPYVCAASRTSAHTASFSARPVRRCCAN